MDAIPDTLAPARDADWRFLLPATTDGPFAHLLLLGGPAGLAATVIDLGIARRVSTHIDPTDRADAVIILAGAVGSLDDAAAQMAEGGVLYWEVDRRQRRQLALTPGRAARRLARLGLTTSAGYWIKPGFPNRDMYLPLAAHGTFRWYLDSLYRSTTRRRRAVKAALGALSARGVRLDSVAPCYAMTAVRGAAAPPAVIARARREGVPVDGMEPVFLAHGRAEWNRLAVLLFEPGAAAPAMVIKMPRVARFNAHTEVEHQTLRELAAGLPPAVRGSIPASSLFHWNGLAVSVESCVGGAALSTRTGLPLPQALDDLRLAGDWLMAFHSLTVVERPPAREWLARHLIDGVIAEYSALFGATAAERDLFAAVSRAAEDAGTAPLPIVWQHTDFGPWNIYRDGERLSVIDWEVARRGPALVDLLYLATHWSAAVDRRATEPERAGNIESLFCAAPRRDLAAAAIHAEIAEYMRRMGMAPSLLPLLLLYTYLEQAIDRGRRSAQAQPGASDARTGNPYIEYVAVLARHAAALFGQEVRHAA